VSRFLTAQQHNLGHLVPLKVKSEKRESNSILSGLPYVWLQWPTSWRSPPLHVSRMSTG